MKKIITIGLIIGIAVATAFAIIYPTRTLVDSSSNLMDINSDGSINIKGI